METTTSEDSNALLGAAREGEPVAWQRLFRMLAPKVAGYLRLQGATDIDDLVSEVFIGVFRNIASFEGSWDQFRSWVFVIAHRRLIDQRRSRGRAPEFVADATDDSPAPGGDVTDEALNLLSTERAIELCARLVVDRPRRAAAAAWSAASPSSRWPRCSASRRER